MSGSPKIFTARQARSASFESPLVVPANGFSLVELLVVIAVIGILVSLLLPAIQSARESARNSACRDHLYQLAIAANNHVAQRGHFPTGGWGHGWTGDPDQGYGINQPGGWVFNLLPFIEEQSLYDRGRGLSEADKKAAAGTVISTPIAIMNCPTRRPAIAYPNTSPRQFHNADRPPVVARADYAANCGSSGGNVLDDQGGPLTLIEGKAYGWPNPKLYTGICYVRSTIRPKAITDGTSKTYLFAEKYLNPDLYDNGDDPSDWGHMFVGHGAETLRMANLTALPHHDEQFISNKTIFGSAHAQTYNAAFCDGSVLSISYEIDPRVHLGLGNRKDGEPAKGVH